MEDEINGVLVRYEEEEEEKKKKKKKRETFGFWELARK